MKVVYLPLDERPCNSQFALRIAQGSDVDIISPPMNMLGDKKVPADSEGLQSFLLENARDADCFVIAVDMLLYGGIVPSRLHHLKKAELGERLRVFDRIKEINPGTKIYAFALITRCPSYSSADEEPDYYELCGREIFLTGQTKHKMQLGLIDEADGKALIAEYAQKTGPYLSDFEERRALNREMLLQTASRLGNSIDFMVIPQDDSSPYGYTTMDREYLKGELKVEGKEIAMYPGADEVGMTLLARAVCDHYGKHPRIYCVYPKPECENVIPLYEDRPIRLTLPHQIESAGCTFSDEAAADVILYLNYPTKDPVNVGEELTLGYDDRDMPRFCEDIVKNVRAGRRVSVADCALCNGGDIEFVKMLENKIDLFELCAYAGWNTSSNTLGTVICQSVFDVIFGKSESRDKFLAERFYEDVGYCGYVRKYVVENELSALGLNYFDAGEKDGAVAVIVRKELLEYIEKNLGSISRRYTLDICQMPWRRMFEVNITVRRRI